VRPLIVPAIVALVIHAVALSFQPPWSQPMMTVPESRAVTIRLVQQPPPEPAAVEPVAPLKVAAPKAVIPLAPLTLQKEVRPEPAPRPEPEKIPTPPVNQIEPSPARHLNETVPENDVVPKDEVAPPPLMETAAINTTPAPETVLIQASVPLYHLNPPPTYPRVARRRNYQGTVLLDVLVDPQGQPTQVKIARSSGHTILDRSAAKPVRNWRFEPARRGDQTIEMWVQVPVRFELQ